MPYLELDDIIFNIQKFGGVTTYWRELTSRLPAFVPGEIIHSSGNKLMRVYSPKSSAKVFHSSHFRVTSSRGVKNVTTIYDLIYEKKMARGRGRLLNLYERKKSVKYADAIVCISESTRRDLYEYYGNLIGSKPVHVIHLGCNFSPLKSLGQESLLARSDFLKMRLSEGQFFLYVGGRSGYKNFDLLLKAFVAGNFSSQGFSLICTGAKFNADELEQIKNLKLEKAIFSIGLVDEASLGGLYSVARALVYPSIYEGFGLPPLEAMAMGCPVICANASSLPEVVGTSGILVDPYSVEELADAMRTVLLESVRAKFSKAGVERAKAFDWNESAARHAKVYESLAPF